MLLGTWEQKQMQGTPEEELRNYLEKLATWKKQTIAIEMSKNVLVMF